MAIIKELPGLEVCVKSNGRPLIEYDDEDALELPGKDKQFYGPQIHTYVECSIGQDFIISYTIEDPFEPTSTHLEAVVEIDGKFMLRHHIELPDRISNERIVQQNSGVWRVDRARHVKEFRRFKFAALTITESEDALHYEEEDIRRVSAMGTIFVRIYRASKVQTPAIPTPKAFDQEQSRVLENREIYEVHEKALKGDAKSVRMEFSNIVQSVPLSHESVQPYTNKYTKTDGRDHPLAMFCFRYRSREDLEKLYVVRRADEPPGYDRIDPRLLALSDSKIKEEESSSRRISQDVKHEIKREVKVEREKGTSSNAEEMIDPTED